jgi:hypothetical protein
MAFDNKENNVVFGSAMSVVGSLNITTKEVITRTLSKMYYIGKKGKGNEYDSALSEVSKTSFIERSSVLPPREDNTVYTEMYNGNGIVASDGGYSYTFRIDTTFEHVYVTKPDKTIVTMEIYNKLNLAPTDNITNIKGQISINNIAIFSFFVNGDFKIVYTDVEKNICKRFDLQDYRDIYLAASFIVTRRTSDEKLAILTFSGLTNVDFDISQYDTATLDQFTKIFAAGSMVFITREDSGVYTLSDDRTKHEYFEVPGTIDYKFIYGNENYDVFILANGNAIIGTNGKIVSTTPFPYTYESHIEGKNSFIFLLGKNGEHHLVEVDKQSLTNSGKLSYSTIYIFGSDVAEVTKDISAGTFILRSVGNDPTWAEVVYLVKLIETSPGRNAVLNNTWFEQTIDDGFMASPANQLAIIGSQKNDEYSSSSRSERGSFLSEYLEHEDILIYNKKYGLALIHSEKENVQAKVDFDGGFAHSVTHPVILDGFQGNVADVVTNPMRVSQVISGNVALTPDNSKNSKITFVRPIDKSVTAAQGSGSTRIAVRPTTSLLSYNDKDYYVARLEGQFDTMTQKDPTDRRSSGIYRDDLHLPPDVAINGMRSSVLVNDPSQQKFSSFNSRSLINHDESIELAANLTFLRQDVKVNFVRGFKDGSFSVRSGIYNNGIFTLLSENETTEVVAVDAHSVEDTVIMLGVSSRKLLGDHKLISSWENVIVPAGILPWITNHIDLETDEVYNLIQLVRGTKVFMELATPFLHKARVQSHDIDWTSQSFIPVVNAITKLFPNMSSRSYGKISQFSRGVPYRDLPFFWGDESIKDTLRTQDEVPYVQKNLIVDSERFARVGIKED